MADEIHVGDVAVGVVPDLSGFNDRLRSELVPAANSIGQDIGREITKGITSSLNIGKAVPDPPRNSLSVITAAGDASGHAYGRALIDSIQSEVRRNSVKVDVTADTTAARAEIARLGGSVTENVRTTGGNNVGGIAGAIGGNALIAGGVAAGLAALPALANLAAAG